MSTDQIRWKRGEYRKFFAKMRINVGGAHPVAILAQDEFEYDGTILKYAGAEITNPGLRTAIREGWADEDADSNSAAVSAYKPNRNVAAAQTVNRDLSRVQRGQTQNMDTDQLDEQTVLDVSDRRQPAANPRATPNVLTQGNNRRVNGMNFQSDTSDGQDGVTIGRVRSATHVRHDVTAQATSSVINELENRNLGRPEIFDRGTTVQREGVTIRTNVGQIDPGVSLSQDDEGVEVGRVHHSARASSEGIEVTDTSNIRDKNRKAPTRTAAPAPTRTAAKVASPAVSKLPAKVRIARAIDPQFPSDWSFEGKLADRLARVKEHGADPTFLEALYAAEGDQMRKALAKSFPKQFGK